MDKKLSVVGLVAATILLCGRLPAGAHESFLAASTRDGVPQSTPSVASSPLTVETAVRIALDRNPVMRAAAEGVRIAQEAAAEARAPYYPALSVGASYARWETHAFLPEGP